MLRALSLLSVAVLASSVSGQGFPGTTPPLLIVRLLPFADDEEFGKELKLKPEQVKKLVDFRKKQWDEAAKGRPVATARTAQEKATAELFKATLDADQHKRAVQLATQLVWATGGLPSADPGNELARLRENADRFAAVPTADPSRVPGQMLAQYPEIAEPLKPTDEQKKLFATGGRAFSFARNTVFLTPEQAKVSRELMGEPVKLTWKGAVNPQGETGRFSLRPTPPALFTLLESEDVRDDLVLTADQTKTFAKLSDRWQTDPFARPAPPVPTREEAAKLLEETLDTLAKTLTPAQLTRLTQIDRQQKSGLYTSFGASDPSLIGRIRIPEVRTALVLSDEQYTAVVKADQAHADAFAKAISSDGSVGDMLKAVAAARTAREKAAEAVLTPEQRKTLDEMLGKPFAGSARPTRGSDTEAFRQARADSFGRRMTVELGLLAEDSQIHAELDLKPEQIGKAAVAQKETREKLLPPRDKPSTPEDRAKRQAEESALVTKAVDGLLTAEQAKRFRQLMLQWAEFVLRRSGASRISAGAIGYPGVAEEIKLTDAQKAKVLAGGSVAAVLTAEQKALLDGLLGKPYSGDWQTIPTGSFAPRMSPPTAAAVLFDNRWDTFGFTAEQAMKLAAAFNECQLLAQPPPFAPGLPPPDPIALYSSANERFAKLLAEILTPEQTKRLDQARFRVLAALSVQALFACPEVVKRLGLTDDQSAKITLVLTDVQRLRVAAVNSFGRGQASREWFPKIAELDTARASAILTGEQRAVLKALLGEPVPNLSVRPRTLHAFPASSGLGGL